MQAQLRQLLLEKERPGIILQALDFFLGAVGEPRDFLADQFPISDAGASTPVRIPLSCPDPTGCRRAGRGSPQTPGLTVARSIRFAHRNHPPPRRNWRGGDGRGRQIPS